MSLFTPVSGLIGGSLVGAAAGSLLLLNGDIMGYSGILSSVLLRPVTAFRHTPWKLTFLASFCWASTCYMRYIDPNCLKDSDGSAGSGGPSQLAFMISGFLVGFGTKLGNGCTSGHGICGLARLSKRSLANVLCFMSTGILTSCLLFGHTENDTAASTAAALLRTSKPNPIHDEYGLLVTVLSILAALPHLNTDRKTVGASVSGALGAIGLAVSGMIEWTKIANFLNVTTLVTTAGGAAAAISSGAYDPTLACVMGSGVIISWLSYQCLPAYSVLVPSEKCMKKPLLGSDGADFNVPTNTTIDWKLILGGAVFGVGWAIGDLCPGPALFHAAVGSEGVLCYWLPNFVLGAYLAQAIKGYCDGSKEAAASKTTKTT